MEASHNIVGHSTKTILKICILGEGGVGKTTLTRRMITGTFDHRTKMTIGVDFHLLKTAILDPFAPEDKGEDIPQIEIQAQMWDFGGEDRFRFLLPRYCKGGSCGILCYDLARYSTTKYLDEWFQIWRDNAPLKSPLILVGTKADLIEEHHEQEALETMIGIAKRLNIEKYYIISSKNGRNINILINELLILAYKFNILIKKPA